MQTKYSSGSLAQSRLSPISKFSISPPRHVVTTSRLFTDSAQPVTQHEKQIISFKESLNSHFPLETIYGDVAQMVERALSMREVLGSMPNFSTFSERHLFFSCQDIKRSVP